MSDTYSPYWLASALGLNAAGNTGSNLTSLPRLVIHSKDYFCDPDYLKPKDKKNIAATNISPKEQSTTIEVQEAVLQPVTDFHGNSQHADHQLTFNHIADTQRNNNNNKNTNIEQSIDMSDTNNFFGSESALNAEPEAQNSEPEPVKDQEAQTFLTEVSLSRLSSNSTMSQNSSPSPQPGIQPPSQSDSSDKTQNRIRLGRKFKKWQCEALERQYAITKNPSYADRQRLVEELKLSSCQIRSWFQNKRYRVKHESNSRQVLNKILPLCNTVPNIQSSSQLQFNNQNIQCSSRVPSPQYYSSSTSSHQSSLSPQSSTPSCGPFDFPTTESGVQKPPTVGFEEWQLKTLNEFRKGGDMCTF
ncbi:hypothetical protein CAEBREN_25560 [Caenorhabditis brenneri]|uniref:Homeobox domain-containing protein n=1 Tax=Caenorhabditis brenneri TaxID=135651 RepID=G0NKT1_CAEBE|nr:hypothetical protein CAEBREN_25560 [Caenorhabditis brenneri]